MLFMCTCATGQNKQQFSLIPTHIASIVCTTEKWEKLGIIYHMTNGRSRQRDLTEHRRIMDVPMNVVVQSTVHT